MYKEWAEAQSEKIKNILNSARADHTQAVKNRIVDVQQMTGVIDITKTLFEVSKVSIVAVSTGDVGGSANADEPLGNRQARG